MKIAVFGATGKTGMRVVQQALGLGYQVKAFVRDPKKMTITSDKLEVVAGDVLNPIMVDSEVESVAAIIAALGSKPDTSQTVLTDGTKNIINSMKKFGIKRLILESSYPMSGSPEGMKFLEGTPEDMMKMMKIAIDDKIGQEKAVKENGLDWTIVRPLILTDGEKTGHYRVGEKLDIKKTDTISRADVADFILKELTENSWLNKTVTISY